MNATWPFAGLEVRPGQLRLSGLLLGDHVLRPDEIVALKPRGFIPLIGWGVQIVHTRPDIPETLIFWHVIPPSRLIAHIHESGLRETGTEAEQPDREKTQLPFKSSVLATGFIGWNGLLLVDFLRLRIGLPSLLALWSAFVAMALVLQSDEFRGVVLEEGRELGHAKNYVLLVLVVSGFMAIVMTLMVAAGNTDFASS